MKNIKSSWILMVLMAGLVLLAPGVASAHCDTLDGPVVMAAKQALDKGDITPVLKWIKQDSEPELRAIFAKTLVVRKNGPEARELADMYFFETLVRLHRAGEGAPYTGLKPAGGDIPHVVLEADKALETGTVEKVIKHLKHGVEEGIQSRFAKVMEKKKHAAESVAAGREYVEAYVEYVHYVENLYISVTAKNPHGEGGHAAHNEKH